MFAKLFWMFRYRYSAGALYLVDKLPVDAEVTSKDFNLFWDFEQHGAIGADLLGVFGRLVIVKIGDDALVTDESDVGLESSKKKRSKHRLDSERSCMESFS